MMISTWQSLSVVGRRSPGGRRLAILAAVSAATALALALAGCAAAVRGRTAASGAADPRLEPAAEREAPPYRIARGFPAIPNDEQLQGLRPRRPAPAAHAAAGAATVPGTWSGRGSTNQAGRTQVVAVSADGQSLLVGTGGGNIFGGSPQAGWQPRADSLDLGSTALGVRSLVVAPGNPEVWLAAGYYGSVEFSIDGGATWSLSAGIGGLGSIFRVARDGGNPRTVYVLAGLYNGTAQIFRSTDGGQSFTGLATLPLAGNDGGPIAPGADLWTSRTASGPLYVMLPTGQLLRSTDQGATFAPLGAAGPGSSNMAVLAGSEAGAPTLYALLGNDFGSWVLYGSDDGGKSWSQRYAVSKSNIWYSGNGRMATSRSNPKLVLFGGVLLYRSTDGGRTFQQAPSDYPQNPRTQLHVDVDGLDTLVWQGRETLFVNTDGGTYMSGDGGASYQNISLQQFPDSQYYSTYSSPQNPDLILAGAQDQGLQLSHPAAGQMAFDQVFGGDFGALTSSSGQFKDVFFAGFSAIGYAPDASQVGANTIFISMPPFTGRFGLFSVLLADPEDPTSVYAAGDHIYHILHADQGGDAPQVRLPQDFTNGGNDFIAALAISPADKNYWYAVTIDGVFWSSHDHGVTWQTSSAGSTSGRSLLASAQDPNTCYAGTGFADDPVVMTTDGGASWTSISNGLPSTQVWALAFDDPAKGNLYAATDDGPFAYDAGAGTWNSLLGGGAPATRYFGVEGVPAAGVVRFATFGRGIWDYSPAGSAPPPPPPPPGKCTPGTATLCLAGGRFQVQATWQNQFNDTSGQAMALPRTDETGFLAFTDPTNVELIVKILDLDGTFKVFYGELTDLHFTLTVSDVATGAVKTYTNTAGDCGAIDETGFKDAAAKLALAGGSGRSTAPGTAAPAALPPATAVLEPAAALGLAAPGRCRPSSSTLCLMNDRFALGMQWSNPGNGTSGNGSAVPLKSDLSGAFYFTDPADLELVVKVLDLGSRIAVFYGTLSDLEYTLTVTDTTSGQVKSYHNPAGNYCGGRDDSAFTP